MVTDFAFHPRLWLHEVPTTVHGAFRAAREPQEPVETLRDATQCLISLPQRIRSICAGLRHRGRPLGCHRLRGAIFFMKSSGARTNLEYALNSVVASVSNVIFFTSRPRIATRASGIDSMMEYVHSGTETSVDISLRSV